MNRAPFNLAAFEKAVRETPREFYVALREDLEQCLGEFAKLSAVLEEKCGADANGHSLAPPSSAVRGALEACQTELRGITRDLFSGGEEAPSPGNGEGGPMVSLQGRPVELGAVVRTREDAFRALLQVAEYLQAHRAAFARGLRAGAGRAVGPDAAARLVDGTDPRAECAGTDIQGGGHQTTGATLIGDLPTAAGRPPVCHRPSAICP